MSYLNNVFKFLMAFVLSLLFIGCSSLSGPLFKPATNIPTDKSVIYLYRPNDNKNSEFTITYNNIEVCILESGGYFAFFAAEGKVELLSSVNFKLFATGLLDQALAGTTDLIFTAEPEKSYYVQCQAIGSQGQELSMKLVPENFGINDIKECRLLDPISP